MLTQGHQNLGTLVTCLISHLKMRMSISEGFKQFYLVGPLLLLIYAKLNKDRILLGPKVKDLDCWSWDLFVTVRPVMVYSLASWTGSFMSNWLQSMRSQDETGQQVFQTKWQKNEMQNALQKYTNFLIWRPPYWQDNNICPSQIVTNYKSLSLMMWQCFVKGAKTTWLV